MEGKGGRAARDNFTHSYVTWSPPVYTVELDHAATLPHAPLPGELDDVPLGAVLLLVCATGSRWTDDPRAQTDDGTTPGWCWFTQVDTVRWSIFERPKVEDVQACAVRGRGS